MYFTLGASSCGAVASESIHWLIAEVHSSGLTEQRLSRLEATSAIQSGNELSANSLKVQCTRFMSVEYISLDFNRRLSAPNLNDTQWTAKWKALRCETRRIAGV